MKKILLWTLGVIAAIVIAAGVALGPTLGRFLAMTTVDVDPNLKIVLGGGGNTTLLKTPDHQQVLVIDTKIGPGAKKLKAIVDAFAPGARVTVVNTHDHPDHTGGNGLFPQANLIAGDYPDAEWRKGAGPRLPDEKIVEGAELMLTFGGETVKIVNLGQAHTTNDLVIYLTRHRLLVVGDLVFNGWNPVLRKDSGAHVGKWIQALDLLLKNYDPQTVVPGHGPLTGRDGLLAMRDYFSSIYSAVGDPKALGALKQKYKGYFSLPMASGFDRTAAFIEAEKKAGR